MYKGSCEAAVGEIEVENMKKIGIVTTTRADYGILKPLIVKLMAVPSLEVCLLVTGTHLESEYGETINEIVEDGLPIHFTCPILDSQNDALGISRTVANSIVGFAQHFQNEREAGKPYDMMILLGDRTEILGVCISCVNERIPIGHLHGGERSEGAVDERVRHAVTKMSQYHFAAAREYGKRIIQMGEQPERVFVVGALGIENVKKEKLIPELDIKRFLGIPAKREYVIVTFHPETLLNEDIAHQVDGLISFITKHVEMDFVITRANADQGGKQLNLLWEKLAEKEDHIHLFSSLGMRRYLSAVKYAKFVMGNSSSGIIEAPALGCRVLDIGDRQKGRLCSARVLHTTTTLQSIEEGYRQICENQIPEDDQPFGDGATSDRIVNQIKNILWGEQQTTEKNFYDIDF